MNLLERIRPKIVYALADPETTIIRYIGCSTDPRARLWHHLWDGRSFKADYGVIEAKHAWLAGLRARGLRPELVILEEVAPGDRWQDREAFWIDLFREPELTNFDLRSKPRSEHDGERTRGWNGGRFW
jgi:hypothetical protein